MLLRVNIAPHTAVRIQNGSKRAGIILGFIALNRKEHCDEFIYFRFSTRSVTCFRIRKILALIRTGISKGFLPALIFSLGCSVGDMIFVVLSVTGIAFLIQSSTIFQWVLWIAGTVMLLLLAYQSFSLY
ncbi:LysE family transporter [Paenibacillus sp. WST5]|uniref:LysE family transporter n=1 Tax=Paenibacillus sedimenti TaxID=2770274 RepID=A0A926QKK6_9BACL|nr:LysE family transporter [Paenibacillus sedimenti]